ncbi:Biotin carboxyl carrier protein of acetyl-CoA carboxylase [Spatholobus suberectus]|nr:Biotin carboxyl carrier protein of acetyl-CoA carboxylase [Spatholobus suberectus]
MASSLAPATKAPTNLRLTHSFRLSPKPNNLRFVTNKPGHMLLCTRVKAQLNEVVLDSSSNAAPPTKAKLDKEPPTKPSTELSSSILATQESVSEFITQVSSLIKLVDSRDIVELKLKQHDCEVIIRKKEAMPQLQPAPQPAVVYSPPSPAVPVAPFAPASTPTPTLARPTPTPTSPPAIKSAKSSHTPLKCPMAGTFYRSAAPGEPPFVKVGDKVKKGQVVCIIEAMKLMNEIEADQSGTIVEILAEDGKPVSVDTPLFVIEP